MFSSYIWYLKNQYMRNIFLLLLAFVLLCSHDLYVKMESYFLDPG